MRIIDTLRSGLSIKSILFVLSSLIISVNLCYADNTVLENGKYMIKIDSQSKGADPVALNLDITDKRRNVVIHQERSIIFTTGPAIKDSFFITESVFLIVFYYNDHNGMLLSSISRDGKLVMLEFRVGIYAIDSDRKTIVHSNWGYGRQYLSQIDLAGTIESLNSGTKKGATPSSDTIVKRVIFDVFSKHPEASVSAINWIRKDTFELELSEREGKQHSYYKYLLRGVTPKASGSWGDITITKVP